MMGVKLTAFTSIVVISLLAGFSRSFDVLNREVEHKKLRVEYGRSAFITWDHLPINRKLTKIGLCRVEVIDIEPLSSAVGHLEPKIFPCSFKNFTIRYNHEGSRLTRSDRIHLRVFFFRTFISATNRTQIDVELVEPVGPSRVQVSSDLFVQNWKGTTSQALSPQLVSVRYNRSDEYCEMEHSNVWYTNLVKHPWLLTHSWPRSGLLVTFNKTKVYSFKHECHNALLMGYRFMSRQSDSPPLDFLPITVRIFKMLHKVYLVHQERLLIPIHISTASRQGKSALPPPVKVKNFRIVQLENVGGTLSPLPSDIIELGVADRSRKPLIVHVLRLDGPIQARLVNLRDSSEHVLSFSYSDLVDGRICFYLNQYSDSQLLHFRMDLVVMDTYFVRSERIDIKLISQYSAPYKPSKVFTRPFLVYTSQRRGLRPYNIQIVGVSKAQVKYRFLDNPDHIGTFYKNDYKLSRKQYFTPYDLDRARITYRHNGGLLKSFPLKLEVTLPGNKKIRIMMPVRFIRLYENSNINLTTSQSTYDMKKSKTINLNTILFNKTYMYYIMKDKVDIEFKIVGDVSYGNVIQQIPGFSRSFMYKKNHRISFKDIIAGFVYFEIYGLYWKNSYIPGMLKLQQINHHKNFQTKLLFISRKDYDPNYLIDTDAHSRRLTCKETSLYCVISERFLNFQKHSYGKSDVVYRIVKFPYVWMNGSTADAGRIISLRSLQQQALKGDTMLETAVEDYRKAQVTSVSLFNQKQVVDRDIVYIPPNVDVGPSDRNVSLNYNVYDGEGFLMTSHWLGITIQAVNNQVPKMFMSNLTLPRDGILEINHRNLIVKDEDTKYRDLQITIHSLPKFGTLKVAEKPIKELKQKFSASLLKKNKLEYFHNGRNVKRDFFNISVFDGINSTPVLEVPIRITRRVHDSSMRLFYTNKTIIVRENSTLNLQADIFKKLMSQRVWSATHNPWFTIVAQPTLGIICVRNSSDDESADCNRINNFDYKTVKKSRLFYRHSGNEVGKKPKYDFAQIWVMKTGEDFYINFTISPVNNKPPELVIQMMFGLNEGSDAPINIHNLAVRDLDSDPADLSLEVVSSPKWGIIAHKNQPLVPLRQFKLTQIMRKDILYRHTLSGGGNEHSSDTFSVKAFDGELYSEIREVLVIIYLQNDEIPVIELHDFNVALSQKKLLDSRLLMISDADVPSSILYFSLLRPLQYGDLVLQHQFSEVVTTATSPISTQVLGVARLLYVQNATRIPRDSNYSSRQRDVLSLRVNDGRHNTSANCTITITGPNRGAPVIRVGTLHLNSASSVNISSQHISVLDNDTQAEDLYLILVTTPTRGFLALDSKKLLPGSVFSQRNINEHRVSFSYTGIEKPVLRDRFIMLANDGFFNSSATELVIALRNPIPVNKMLLDFVPIICNIDDHYTLSSSYLTIKNPNRNLLANLSFIVPRNLTCGYFYTIQNFTTTTNSKQTRISTFTYSQLINNQVHFYIPSCLQAIAQLTIPYQAKSTHGYAYKSKIRVSVLPKRNKPPNLSIPLPFDVVAESDVPLTVKILSCLDIDNVDSELKYTALRDDFQILLNHKATDTFTQADVASDKVILRLLRNKSNKLEFALTDGVNKEIMVNGNIAKDGKFSIVLNRINWGDTKKMKVLRFSRSEVRCKINKKLAFFYTAHNILVTNRHTVIKTTSKYKQGQFYNSHTNKTVTEFRQIDVNRRRIYFVLNKNKRVPFTEDHIWFKFVSNRSSHSKKLVHEWNRIQFFSWSHLFCAYPGVVTIPIFYKSRITVYNMSVTIKLESKQLVEKQHYQLLSDKIIHFVSRETPLVKVKLLSFPTSNSTLTIEIFSGVNVVVGRIYYTNVNFRNSSKCKYPSTMKRQVYNLNNMMQQDKPQIPTRDAKLRAHKPCREGWKIYKNRCYGAFEKKPESWQKAKEICESNHGFLTSVENEKNLHFLLKLFHQPYQFWIGLRRKENKWRYVNNQLASYTAWDNKFPRQKFCKRKYANHCNFRGKCVLVTKNGKWRNRSCKKKKARFVCMANPRVY